MTLSQTGPASPAAPTQTPVLEAKRLVKTFGMVNCMPDFTEAPRVINGFNALMVEVFGETSGRGVRSAVGMNSLPSGSAVEIEAIFQIKS